MKQQSPLHKKDKWRRVDFSQIHRYLNRPTPAQQDAGRRETDEPCGELGHSEEHVKVVGGWDAAIEDLTRSCKAKPIRDIAQAFVGGMGLGAAITALVALIVGHPEMFGTATLILVACVLGYLYLDGE